MHSTFQVPVCVVIDVILAKVSHQTRCRFKVEKQIQPPDQKSSNNQQQVFGGGGNCGHVQSLTPHLQVQLICCRTCTSALDFRTCCSLCMECYFLHFPWEALMHLSKLSSGDKTFPDHPQQTPSRLAGPPLLISLTALITPW